jgi:hypothetical protein
MNHPSDTDELRRRYRYRALILRGKVRVPVDAAKRLIGPDCAYHLYRTIDSVPAPDEGSEPEDADPK